MVFRGQNPRQFGRYMALAQVGLEMVAPIALGWWLDRVLDWFPWCTVIGTVLGLVLGFVRLIRGVSQLNGNGTKDEHDGRESRDEAP